MARLLVVDDEPSMRELLAILLKRSGHEVATAASGDEALARFDEVAPALVIQDLKMPGIPGLELLRRLKERAPQLPVIVMTAFATWDNTVEAMRLGAYGYVKKPFDTEEVRQIVERGLQRTEPAVPGEPALMELLGSSPPLLQVIDVVRRVAPTEATVLVQGESGTGKELVARMCHNRSPRSGKPFIAVNCGAFTESLLESELFGHVKGAFTGAVTDKKGLFAVAEGGTFFLDEVGEMPMTTQVKLLRVLEDRRVLPVGGTRAYTIDVRFVCATNRDLATEVRDGRFRSDLFYRLNVIPISLPPLRARADDVALLAGHFVRKYAKRLGRDITAIAPDVQARLQAYSWPGNVRELENVIQRAIALAQGPVLTAATLAGLPVADAVPAAVVPTATSARAPTTTWSAPSPSPLPAARAWPEPLRTPDGPAARPGGGLADAPAPTAWMLRPPAPEATTGLPFLDPPSPGFPAGGYDLEATLAHVERLLLEQALAETGGNVTRAAEVLGITFRSMRYKLKKLGLRGSAP